MTARGPLDPGSAHEAPLDGRAPLLPLLDTAAVADLAERATYALQGLRCRDLMTSLREEAVG